MDLRALSQSPDWGPFREEILRCWRDGQKLKAIMTKMESYGLRKSERQYKRLFDNEGLRKKGTAGTWAYINRQLSARGEKKTQVLLWGNIVPPQTVARNRKRNAKSLPITPTSQGQVTIQMAPPTTPDMDMNMRDIIHGHDDGDEFELISRASESHAQVDDDDDDSNETSLYGWIDMVGDNDLGNPETLRSMLRKLNLSGIFPLGDSNEEVEFLVNIARGSWASSNARTSPLQASIALDLDVSWLWDSLKVIFSQVIGSEPLAVCHVPGIPGEASALANSSETELTNFLVSSFTCGSPTKWTIQEHLLQWLSQPTARRFLGRLLAATIRKHKGMVDFAMQLLEQRRLVLGKHPEPKLLHMEVAAFLFEGLLSTNMIKTAPNRLYKLALYYPLPNIIQTLLQSGDNVKGCKQSLRHFAPLCLGNTKIASMLLRNGASPDSGLQSLIEAYLKSFRVNQDTTSAENLIYWLLSHGADPNRITETTFPLTIAEYSQSQCPKLGEVFHHLVTDRISQEVLSIYDTGDHKAPLTELSAMAKELVLLATFRQGDCKKECLGPDDLQLTSALLNHGAHPDVPTVSMRNFNRFLDIEDSDIYTTKPLNYSWNMYDGAAMRLLLEAGCSLPVASHVPWRSFSSEPGRGTPEWIKMNNFLRSFSSCLRKVHGEVPGYCRDLVLQWAIREEDLDITSQLLAPTYDWQHFMSHEDVSETLGLGAHLLSVEREVAGSYELVGLCLFEGLCQDVPQKVQFLLQHGASVVATHPFPGRHSSDMLISPLQAACLISKARSKALEVRVSHSRLLVNLLISLGADVNSAISPFPTPFQLATYSRNIDVMEHLLQIGADVNMTRNDPNFIHIINSLIMICKSFWTNLQNHPFTVGTRLAVIQRLVSEGLDVNFALNHERFDYNHEGSPLVLVCRHGDFPLVKILVDCGGAVNFPSYVDGRTPIEEVCNPSSDFVEPNPDIALLLLESGARIDGLDDVLMDYSLRHALERRDVSEVRNILAQIARHRALLRAIWRGHTAQVRSMIECGTDVNFRPSGYRFAAIGFAIRQGNSAALTLLLENGADLQVTSLDGETPLSAAIDSVDLNMVRLLSNAGVSRDYTSADFDYYMGMADSRTFSFAVDLLREWREKSRVAFEPLETIQPPV